MSQNCINYSTFAKGQLVSGNITQNFPTPASDNLLFTQKSGNLVWGIPNEWEQKVLIQSVALNNVTSVTFTNIPVYDRYIVELIGVKCSGDGAYLNLYTSNNNGASYQTAYNNYGLQSATYNGTSTVYGGGVSGKIGDISITPSAGGTPNIGAWAGNGTYSTFGFFYITGLQSSNLVYVRSKMMWNSVQQGVTYGFAYGEGCGNNGLTSTIPSGQVNAIKIQIGSYALTEGTIRFFGAT